MASAPFGNGDRTPAPLPFDIERAFVVHLCTATGSRPRRIAGQVEHLWSGDSAQFSSLQELVAFFVAKTCGGSEPAVRAAHDPSGARVRGRSR